jgi:hypothetical protein
MTGVHVSRLFTPYIRKTRILNSNETLRRMASD